MKIISWNVNGIRAVYRKGFLQWFKEVNADVVCLQEIKAETDKIPQDLVNLPGYFTYFNPAEKPGYAGVAVFCKEKPLQVEQGIGFKRFDKEGRALCLKFGTTKNSPGFTLFNFYIPFGGREKENLDYKLQVYNYLLNCRGLTSTKKVEVRPLLLVGDFNVAHKEIDLARPKENKDNIMFTKEEREQIDRLIEIGFIDTFRKFYPKKAGAYTWWTHFANARERNLGWRIDYCFASQALSGKLKDGFILHKVMGSDHCPVGVVLK